MGAASSRLRAAGAALLRARTLADAVRPPLDALLGRGPGGTLPLLATAAIAYLLWLPLGALWAGLAALLGTPLVFAATLLAVLGAGRLLARAMVFPGSLPVIANSLEREVAGHLRGRLVEAATAVDGACRALLQAAAAGAPPARAHAAGRACPNSRLGAVIQSVNGCQLSASDAATVTGKQ